MTLQTEAPGTIPTAAKAALRRTIHVPGRRAAISASSRAALAVPASNYYNRTYGVLITAEAPFDAVRVLFGNADTANAATVAAASVAVTGSLADVNPSGGGVLTALTFGGSASLAIPAADRADRPRLAWSDWLPLSSIPRTDGGSLPLLIARAFFPDAAPSFTANLANAAWFPGTDDPLLNGHRLNSIRGGVGNQTAGGFGTTAQVTVCPIIGFEFRYRQQVISIVGFGDSIMEGAALTKQMLTYLQQAVLSLSTVDKPISFHNLGRGGDTSAQYFQRTMDYLAAKDVNGFYVNSPTALAYSIGTPNDGQSTAVTIANARNRAYQVYEACRQRDIIFMPVSVIPRVNSDNTSSINDSNGDDGFRQALNAEFMAIDAADAIPIDWAAAVQNPTNPKLFIDTTYFMPGDGTHASDLAQIAGAVPAKAGAAQLVTMLN